MFNMQQMRQPVSAYLEIECPPVAHLSKPRNLFRETDPPLCADTGAVSRRSGGPPITSGTKDADPSAGNASRPCFASLRQAVRYCGATP